jgi:hypothetical protein
VLLARWGERLPRVPEGDLVVAMDGAGRASVAVGAQLERAERWLQQWPVAGVALLALGILFAVLMRWGS